MGAGSPRPAARRTTPSARPVATRQLAAVAVPLVAASWPLGQGIVILGPPGAGKGTQAQRLTTELGLAVVSTGELLRSNVAEGTPLGRSVEAYLNRGDLVPDELVTEMVLDRLGAPDVPTGFLLDGFPRTVRQAEKLDAWLGENGAQLGAALSFEITEGELLRRLATRARQQRRRDDAADTVRHRLKVFAQLTQPLLQHFERQGILLPIDAHGTPDEVFDRVLGGLAAMTARSRVARRARSRPAD